MIKIQDEKIIRKSMFEAIEVYLIVREYMRKKYKDFPLESLKLQLTDSLK